MMTLDDLRKIAGAGVVVVINNLTINDNSCHLTIEAEIKQAPKVLYPWSDYDPDARRTAADLVQKHWGSVTPDEAGYL